MLNEKDFVDTVLTEFPSLRDDFTEWKDLLHLQMREFCEFTETAATTNDNSVLRRCLELADRFMREGDKSIRNALYVSFLEHLPRQGDTHNKLRQSMSPAMCKHWDDILAYLASIRQER